MAIQTGGVGVETCSEWAKEEAGVKVCSGVNQMVQMSHPSRKEAVTSEMVRQAGRSRRRSSFTERPVTFYESPKTVIFGRKYAVHRSISLGILPGEENTREAKW